MIGRDVLFAHGTRERGHVRGLSCVISWQGSTILLLHTVVAHAKGVDTTAVCRAAYKVERVTTVHVFFRSCRGFLFGFCAAVDLISFPFF